MNDSDLIGEEALIQGVNYPLEFLYTEDDGTAIDLTGLPLRFVIFNLQTGATIGTYSVASGHITAPLPLTGVSYLNLTATDTAALPSGMYGYKYEIYVSAANVTRIADGRIEVAKIRAAA